MDEKSEPEDLPNEDPLEGGVYLDSSALAKLYVTEVETEDLESFLVGRTDLMICEEKTRGRSRCKTGKRNPQGDTG